MLQEVIDEHKEMKQKAKTRKTWKSGLGPTVFAFIKSILFPPRHAYLYRWKTEGGAKYKEYKKKGIIKVQRAQMVRWQGQRDWGCLRSSDCPPADHGGLALSPHPFFIYLRSRHVDLHEFLEKKRQKYIRGCRGELFFYFWKDKIAGNRWDASKNRGIEKK